MDLRKILPGFVVAGSLLWAPPGAPAEKVPKAETRTAWGLHTTTFDTLHGRVVVNLPAHLAAGDRLSGTVYPEPAGSDGETQTDNLLQLRRLGLRAPGVRGEVSWTAVEGRLPAGADGTSFFINLQNPEGEVLGRAEIPVAGTPIPPSPELVLPEVAQAGRPLTLFGPFDGDAETTSVELDGEAATVLGESPRTATLFVPAGGEGPVELVVREEAGEGKAPLEARGSLRILSLRLSADSVDLKRGQTTRLRVTVSGLEGLTEEIPLEVRNNSPSRIRLEGGQVQTFNIPPSEVSQEGEFSWEGTLVGVQPGAFEIFASVPFLSDPPATPGSVAQALQDQDAPNCRCQRVDLEDKTSPASRNRIQVDEWRRRDQPVGLTLRLRRQFLHRITCTGDRGKCQASTGWLVVVPEVTLRGVRIDGRESTDLSSRAETAELRLSITTSQVGYQDEDSPLPRLALEADCDECRRKRNRECTDQLSRSVIQRINVGLPVAVLSKLQQGASVTFSEVEVSGRWGGRAMACAGAGFLDPPDEPHVRIQKKPSFSGWK